MDEFKHNREGKRHIDYGGEDTRIIITVKDIKGPNPCPRGHIIGDSYIYPYDLNPEETGRAPPICFAALMSLYPELRYMTLFGKYPPRWGDMDKMELMCPDVKVGVVFEMKIGEKI